MVNAVQFAHLEVTVTALEDAVQRDANAANTASLPIFRCEHEHTGFAKKPSIGVGTRLDRSARS